MKCHQYQVNYFILFKKKKQENICLDLSFDPYLLCELNARYLHDMNALDPINENVFSRFVRNKHDDILRPVISKSSKLKMNLSSNLSKVTY